MLKWLEKKRMISATLTILIAIEIFAISSRSSFDLPSAGVRIIPVGYHFTIFFLFTFFLLATIKKTQRINLKILAIVLILSLTYAVSDEYHQKFVPNRDSSMGDFLTDTAGILTSLILYIYIDKNKKN